MHIEGSVYHYQGKYLTTVFYNTISLSRHEQVCLMRLRFYVTLHFPMMGEVSLET